jgi:hypothetical protein
VDILAQISELTKHTRHVQMYEKGPETKVHRVTAPPLLWQLANNHQGGATDNERSGSGYQSRPAARIESLDVLMRIDREASAKVRELGQDDDRDTVGLVQMIAGLLPGQGEAETRDLETLVHRWYVLARVATGWDSPLWRPRNTCPVCQTLGSLRIRLSDLDAFCAECHTTWDRSLIGLLAEHLRQENGEEDTPVEDTSLEYVSEDTPIEGLVLRDHPVRRIALA